MAESLPSIAATPAPTLGRLAQTARRNELRNARGILLLVGILTVGANAYFVAAAESSVQEALDKEIQKLPAGFVVDPVKLQEVKATGVRAARLLNGGAVALGVVFLVFAALVRRYPVPITITALVLYVAANAVFGLLEPTSVLNGVIMKLLIIVGLFKATQAAVAYQKELNAVPGT